MIKSMTQNMRVILREPQSSEGYHEISRYAQDDRKKSQSGNAVIIVLVAIALFAALAYTFTRGAQTGQGNISAGQARIGAQEILSYSSLIERRIANLLSKGCSEQMLSFANTLYRLQNNTLIFAAGHNANAPSDFSCDLFATNGGNIQPVIFEPYVNRSITLTPTMIRHGHVNFVMSRAAGVGNAAQAELLLAIPYVPQNLCLEINKQLGVPATAGGLPPTANAFGFTTYSNGTFVNTDTIPDTDSLLSGRLAYCVRQTASATNDNIFFQVIHAR
jgi:hypothetical protein